MYVLIFHETLLSVCIITNTATVPNVKVLSDRFGVVRICTKGNVDSASLTVA